MIHAFLSRVEESERARETVNASELKPTSITVICLCVFVCVCVSVCKHLQSLLSRPISSLVIESNNVLVKELIKLNVEG